MSAYFNPDKDALVFVYRGFCLSGDRFFEDASPEFLSQIRHVIFDARLMTRWKSRDSVWGTQSIAPFKALKKLDFAFQHHFDLNVSDIVGFEEEGEEHMRRNGMCKTYELAKMVLSQLIDDFTVKGGIVREGVFRYAHERRH